MDLLLDLLKSVLGPHVSRLQNFRPRASMAVAAIVVLAGGYQFAVRKPAADALVADAVVPSRPMIGASAAALPPPASIQTTSPPGTEDALIRALQLGLRDAGCYDGPVSGYWTRKSKEAAGRFVARLNAKLPTEKADQVLLALAKSNPATRCLDGPPAIENSPATPAPAPGGAPSDTPAVNRHPELPREPATMATTETHAVFVPPISTAATPAAAPPSIPEPTGSPSPSSGNHGGKKNRTANSAPEREPSQRANRHAHRQKTETAFSGVSKSMTRNFKSLQRSLASIFN